MSLKPLSFEKNTRVNREGLEVHRYPTDVGSDEYPNYIMFNITKRTGDIGNVEVEAAGAAQQAAATADRSNQNRPDKSPSFGRAIAALGAGAGAGFGVKKLIDESGEAVRSAIAKAGSFGKPVNAVTGLFSTAVGVGVGGAVATFAEKGAPGIKSPFDARDKVLLKTTIALHLNNKPSVSYKAQWADAELGILGGAAETFSQVKDAEGFLETAGTLLNRAGGAAVAAGLKNAANTPLNNIGDFRSFAEANTGKAINPFKAQLFKNMEFRTFSFDYVFLPRNKAEYDSVQTIIKTFKRYMHPKFGDENFFMGYPAEFNIAYFHKAGTNYENIFKLSSCALTDLKVEYGGADFVTFKGTSGAPTEIAMSLSFLELELLSEARVMDGY